MRNSAPLYQLHCHLLYNTDQCVGQTLVRPLGSQRFKHSKINEPSAKDIQIINDDQDGVPLNIMYQHMLRKLYFLTPLLGVEKLWLEGESYRYRVPDIDRFPAIRVHHNV